MTAPERIWAWGGSYPDHDETDWMNATATNEPRGGEPYVRADLYTAQQETIAALVEALKTARDYVSDFSSGDVSFTDGAVMDLDMVADDLVNIDAALARAKEQA